ncbi:MAG: cation diffusion facilitator family transporter [Thermodesulfobacteriota bacterium]
MDIKQKAALFAASSASLLAAGKFGIGLFSGSLAVVSSGLDSLLDVFMSAMNFLAIRKASQPPDETHDYGHAKAENLAAVAQSLVIIFSGAIILYKAGEKYWTGAIIQYTSLDLGIMGLSLIFSLIISTVLRRIGRKTDSNALKADALHYTSDLYSNSAAILAIGLTFYTGITAFDLLFSVVIGIIIIISALSILKKGSLGLMDTRIPAVTENTLMEILKQQPYPFAGFHKLRTRISGSRIFGDLHVLFCRKLKIDEAHDRTRELESEIQGRIPSLDIVIHIEPCEEPCGDSEENCTIRKSASA